MADQIDNLGSAAGHPATDRGADFAGPAAFALGLNGASRDKADGYLDEQIALTAKHKHFIDLQIAHFERDDKACAALDLSAADRAVLARMMAAHV